MKFSRDNEPKPPREWSAIVLWASIFISINIIFGTITWNFARRVQQEHRLQDYATKSCAELLVTQSEAAQKAKTPAITPTPSERHIKTCEKFVEAHHDECLAQAVALSRELKAKKSRKLELQIADEYVTCLMSLPLDQRIALTSPTKDTP